MNKQTFYNSNSYRFSYKAFRDNAKAYFLIDARKMGTGEIGVAVFDIKNGQLIRKYPGILAPYSGKAISVIVDNYDFENWSYTYYCDDKLFTDIRADRYINVPLYGEYKEDTVLMAVFDADFDYSDDIKPSITYSDAFVYQLHVRGFTKHASSGTKYKGTFRGVTDKLDYLKELGVTSLELQPINEFCEVDTKTKRLNYWGYCKGNYYTPKSAYSCDKNASCEFYDLVKAIHTNGQEIILQMYFPADFSQTEIVSILEYWTIKYHIDGFHLLSERLPLDLIDDSCILSDSKIWVDRLEGIVSTKGAYNNAEYTKRYALFRDDYMYAMRRFLKADEFSLSEAIAKLRMNEEAYAVINYLDSFNSLTLLDMVSYERKHNEANGEDNIDGSDYNCSWNCGEEGITRKPKINALRKKQIKNALALLFLSAGTPMIVMGDEIGRTQYGNNNPYCIDSNATWLDWGAAKRQYNLYDYIVSLVNLRKSMSVLHAGHSLSMLDVSGCGFPELSYHGESAWKAQTEGHKHDIGVMFCDNGRLLYMAINMYWDKVMLALPRPPKGQEWKMLLSTGDSSEPNEELNVPIAEHTIAFFSLQKAKDLPIDTDKVTKHKNKTKVVEVTET